MCVSSYGCGCANLNFGKLGTDESLVTVSSKEWKG
jgi:hypothetical protein